ncbi:GIY-YIG nuclease family protein [Fundicoccus sp. Sow4_F4]|uniref:GIY-YIG nuclease family protein n=1 Tax=Fundicoccus sp. Sow4_F4 TaxID=3438783 RepID=UPI003F90B10D
MIFTKKTWWFSTPIIALCFAFWFFIIPFILGLFLISKQNKFYKMIKTDLDKLNTIENLDEEISQKNAIITKIKDDAMTEANLKASEIVSVAETEAEKANKTLIKKLAEKEKELNKKEVKLTSDEQEIENRRELVLHDATEELSFLNERIEVQRESISNNSDELEQLEKEVKKYIRQARKFRSEALGLKYIQENIGSISVSYKDVYSSKFEDVYDVTLGTIKTLSDNELLKTVSTLYLHSDHSRTLRSLSTATKKEIEKTLEKFLNRYQTKTIKSMYNLMVIGLQSEIQLILVNLSYETLDESLAKVNQLIEKYLLISSKGNQSILSTVTRFLSTMQEYYKELVNIEYRYYSKREQEKEEQRLLREQMKQEAAERKILKEEQVKLDREEAKFKTELDRTNEMLINEKDETKLNQLKSRIMELEQQMNSIEERKESIATLANGKAGYVYIISNVGSFGNEVFKIGMTRRLEPQDRVDELGSASVPFRFDVHAFVFSEDAVGLEYELHQKLNESRVNKVNFRKEFFRTSLIELEALVEELDPTAEFNETILALEYKQTIALEKQTIDTVAS